ncbi:MAG: ferritin-like domain-containing protein [Phycisphaeraceae bacterium]
MGFLGHSEFKSMQDLYVHEIEDLYDAEKRLVGALGKMAETARADDLRQAFYEHQRQTEGHLGRLEQIFQMMGRDPERETCPAMKGLIAEGEEMIEARGDAHVRDAALIGAAQRVEHYEIAAYGTARSHARTLGFADQAELLQQTLEEEGETDKRLTSIAESHVNREAET